MYDPARDSWKSDEEEAPEQVQQTSVEKKRSPSPIESNEGEQEPTKLSSELKEDAEDTREENGKQSEENTAVEVEDEKEPFVKETAVTEPELELTKKRTRSLTPNPIEDKEHQEEEKEVTQAKIEQQVETKPQEHEESPESKEPARKIRKPNSRLSQAEREAQAKELRERIERNERRDAGEEEPPRRAHGEAAIVRQHYNQRPDQGVQRRQESPIIKLRSFNNWVKFVLISRFSRRGCTVLDIGCGKGGDLFKWSRAGCSGFIGIDIAEVSISQARERYEKVRHKRFWADFCVGDAFGERVENIVHPDAFPVDIVSSQFCLHYAFENEDRVRMVLSNISRSLRRGGVFIGTIPNSDVINKHIRKLESHELKWGNSIYSVEFDRAPPRDGVFKPPFGHKYKFFLEDAVGNVPEYVVPFEAFRALAEEYHLELEFKKPFLRLFDEELDHNSWTLSTAESMGVVKRDGRLGIEGDEREACGFYLAFAFRKTTD